jgi:heterodisulfide reductase subunit A
MLYEDILPRQKSQVVQYGKSIVESDSLQAVNKKVGAVLVIGGGIAGVQTALDLAELGYYVYLVEQSPAIGGVMAQLDKTFPTNDCSMCILSPKLVECSRHPNIKLITYSEIVDITGEPGNFRAKIKKKARYVDENKCTGCGTCYNNCPVKYEPKLKQGE